MLCLITPQSLKDLVDANAIRHATVIADKDVYKITVKYGTAERLVSVRTREGQTRERVFTSLDAVARFMRERVNLTQYDVDDSNFQPGTKRVTRPDISERMKRAHEAAAHDTWFRAEVEQGIKEADDPSTQWVSNEDANKSWAKQRAALVKRAGSAS